MIETKLNTFRQRIKGMADLSILIERDKAIDNLEKDVFFLSQKVEALTSENKELREEINKIKWELAE